MRENEKEVIRVKESQILDAITEPTQIADILFEQGCLLNSQIEEIYETKTTRRAKCQLLLEIICSEGSNCSLRDLVEAFRQSDVQLTLLGEDILQLAERSGVAVTNDKPDIVYEKVRKVNVYTNVRKRVEALAHVLKRLSHEGDVGTFKTYVTKIDKIYKKNFKSQNLAVTKRMEIADLRFTCLEAEVIMMRVFYDESLYRHNIFKELEKVIPFTSNPTVTSMTFLARHGSARSMNEGIETGLSILEYSKHHAENIVPCRDSGMVYYIEVNLLFQLYETNPTAARKQRILKTAELAISQFVDETESVKNDYKRMLLLKMVFCRLGIGLFGDRIEGAVVDQEDLHAAKNYLDFVELPEIWAGMEARRQMLFHLAKAEYFKHQHQTDMAVMYARQAHTLAIQKQWKKELPPIKTLLTELEAEMEILKSNENNQSEDEEELIAEISDNLRKLEASV